MDWAFVVVGVVALVAAVVQSTTGFGFAIICMAVLPLITPFRTATVIEALMSAVLSAVLVIRLRHHVRLKLLAWPFVTTAVLLPLGLFTLMSNTDSLLRRLLGGLLLVLAAYFAFFGQKIRIRPTPLSGLTTGAVSGFMAGFFGIGGPPLAIFFSSVTEDKRIYSATLNAFFLIMSAYHIVLHGFWGNITPLALRQSAVGVAGLALGSVIGFAIFRKLTMTAIRRLVYVFMALCGLYLIIVG